MRRALPWVLLGVGGTLVVVGVVLFVVGNRPADVGWSAYMPLDMPRGYADYVPGEVAWSGGVVWTRLSGLGAGLAVVGLLALTGLGGWFLGRRSPREQPAD